MGNVVALYIRLSVEDSKVESMSIENQKLALHKFVDSVDDLADLEVQEFVDNGYSGTNFERPAVQELLDRVREGKVQCIIVKDFSRFGRNSLEVGYFMEKVFPLYGVRFISLNDDFDSGKLHGDTGGINVAFKYLISEFYSRDLSQKYKSAKYVKFKRGEYQSKICPYGYQKSADGRMEPDPETAPIVQRMFELAAQSMNSTGIARELVKRGICTPGKYKMQKGQAIFDVSRVNKTWTDSNVTRILRDERYTGVYIIGKREVTEVGGHHIRWKDESQWIKIPNHHPAIIDKEVFDKVQELRPRFKAPKKKTYTYLLRGKVFCGECQHTLSRAANKSPYFHCRHSKANEAAPCHGLKIGEQELESLVYDVMAKQAQVVLGASHSNTNPPELLSANGDEYSKQLKIVQEQKRILFEHLVMREISEAEYKAQKARLDQESDRLQQLHDAVSAQLAQAQMDEQTKSARQQLAHKVMDSGKLCTELVEALIDRVYVYPEKHIEIVWKMRDFALEAPELQKC